MDRLLALLVLPLLGAVAAAQDTVVLKSTGGAPVQLSGEVLEYSGAELRLRRASGREERIDPSRVAEIQTSWPAPAETAQQLVQQGKLSDALAQLQAALVQEQRRWARRALVARQIQLYHHLGRVEEAAKLFLLLIADDPQTPYLHVIPLSWVPQQPGASLESAAQQWIGDAQRPYAVLIGASWLLSGPQRSSAVNALRGLVGETDPRLVHLAEAQLWRSQLVSATSLQLKAWEQQVERMPQELRAGPLFIVGQALAQHERTHDACLAWMKVAILYPDQRPLAAQALYQVARQLEKKEKLSEAAGLYREVIGTYGETSAAVQSKARLAQGG